MDLPVSQFILSRIYGPENWKTTVCPLPPEPSPMEKGLEALQRGDLNNAEARFQDVLESDPKHPFANLHLGNIYLSTGRINLALFVLKRAIASKPDLVQAYLFLANLHERRGNLPEAIKAVQKAYTIFPDESAPGAKALSGQLTLLRNQLEVNTSFKRGIRLLREGKTGAAEKAFRSILDLQTENTQARHFLGLSLGIQTRFEEAIEQFETLLRIKPELVDSRTRLAELYQSVEKLIKARSELETSLFFVDDKDGPLAESLEKKLDDVESKIELKNLLDRSAKELEDNQIDTAITMLQEILKIDPEHALAYFNLGKLWNQKKRFDLAEIRYKKAIEIFPDYTEAHLRLGQVYGAIRSFGRAKRQFEAALATPGGKSKPMRERLRQFIAQSEQGIQQTRKAGKEDFRRSQKRLRAGDLEEAVKFMERAVFFNPENADYRFQLGALYEQKGDIDRASNEMRGALTFNPKLARAHQHLSRFLEKKGFLYQAVKELKLANALQASRQNTQELKRLERKLFEVEKKTFPLIKQAEEEAAAGTKADAITLLKKALSSAPDDTLIHIKLGNLYADTRNVSAAYEAFNNALSLDTKNAAAKYRLGRLYSAAGQWRDAERTFHEMLQWERLPKNIRLKAETDLAIALKKLRDEKDAKRHLQRANRFFSTHDYLAAIESYEKVLGIYPSHVRSLYQTGFSYENLNNDEKAAQIYEKVLELAPKHIQARQRLGFILERQGKNEEAILVYKETLPLFKGEDDPEAIWVKSRLTPLEKRLMVSINHVVLSYNSNPAGSSDPEGDLSSNLGIDMTYFIRKDRRIQIPFAVGTHNTFFFQSNTYFSSESLSFSLTGMDSPFSYSAGYRLRLGLAKDGVTGTDHIGDIGLTWTGALPSTIALNYSYNTFSSVSDENFDALRQNIRLTLTQRWGRDSATLAYRLAENDANLNDQASRTNGVRITYNKAFTEKLRAAISLNFERVQFINPDSLAKARRKNTFRSLSLTTSYVLQNDLVFNLSYTEQRNRSNLPSGAVTVEQRLSGQAESLGNYNQRLLNLSASWSF
ncbi:MAG: tetratricopeptide repeat protein [Nitrospiria bacterium]